MNTFLLFTHVLLALVTLAISTKAVIDVRGRRAVQARRGLVAMWVSFAAVVVSGVALVVITPATLGHACVLMSLYVVIVAGVQIYQKRTLSLA